MTVTFGATEARGLPAAPVFARAAVALMAAYGALLAGAALNGVWLFDEGGRPIATDFLNVWAAGKLALAGQPAAAYDWAAHKAAEVAGLGHDFPQYYGWHYPPTFLLAAAPLALLSYVPAWAIWMTLTLPAYAAAIARIIGHRTGLLLGVAFPAVLLNVSVGQNGFLTAALIGGALMCLERRPVVAGVCLGLLTYKPQFGLLFPLALMVGGHWRAFAAAAATGITLAAISLWAFGSETWIAFADSLPLTSAAVLGQGQAGFGKLQSIFGAVRWAGGSAGLAWALHGVIVTACALAVAGLWRARAPYALKAAGLATAALLATPYLYVYDLVALAVPMAFLIRLGLTEGFRPHEPAGLGLAALLILVFPAVPAPSGLMAVLVVAAMLAARWGVPAAAVASTRPVGSD